LDQNKVCPKQTNFYRTESRREEKKVVEKIQVSKTCQETEETKIKYNL
jgi:hypothetical protein